MLLEEPLVCAMTRGIARAGCVIEGSHWATFSEFRGMGFTVSCFTKATLRRKVLVQVCPYSDTFKMRVILF